MPADRPPAPPRSWGGGRPTTLVVIAVVVAALAAGCARRGPEESSPGSGATLAPTSSTAAVPRSAPQATSGADRPALPARPAVAPTATSTTGSLTTADGRTRTYVLYVPPDLPAGQPVPLLVALHGGTGWGAQFEANSGFDGLAQANGFIVVYPDGTGAGRDEDRLRTWNGGRCCGSSVKEDVDDVAFISLLIDTLSADHDIDPRAVFAAGHSNGGIMAYRLACQLGDKVAAVGVQASSMEVDGCKPAEPVSAIAIHGTDDRNIPIDGGAGDRSIANLEFRPPRDAVRALAAADGCPAAPVDAVDAANGDLTVTTWEPCAAGTEVEFVAVAGGTHAWMGHGTKARLFVGEPYQDLDSSLAIWTFLAAHPRAG